MAENDSTADSLIADEPVGFGQPVQIPARRSDERLKNFGRWCEDLHKYKLSEADIAIKDMRGVLAILTKTSCRTLRNDYKLAPPRYLAVKRVKAYLDFAINAKKESMGG